ncbi:MAG: hypothetical protein U9N85_04800 [Bacteroidota bacterium]|nr:hypothetical protein [Bacteroidota bacterium]
MKIYKIGQVLLLLLIITTQGFSQYKRADFLITEPIYNDTFGVINHKTEKRICKTLMQKDFNDLLADSIVNRNDMRGFALPLGVFKNSDSVNYSAGMLKMWTAKGNFIINRNKKMSTDIYLTALTAIDRNLRADNTMSIREYRELHITSATQKMKNLHNDMKDLYSPARKEFMSLIVQNITPNVLLGFNIQELMPPSHMLTDGSIKPINPIFKAYYYDLLLRGAGTEFVQFFPSRFDQINSFGPFQLTSIALDDINTNARLSDKFKRFASLSDLKTIDHHNEAAVFFAYDNWERLSYQLKSDSTIYKFNTFFKGIENNLEKKRKLQIFISGMTACLHHHPPNSRKMIRKYLSETDDLNKLHYECIKQKGNKQLRKYYQSSVEAFLIMKVYHKLIEQYGQ